jgi:shikimate kinase
MTISLTGFMGCGKSSVGRRLSALLCWSYADLDAVIEGKAGRSIPEIFASEGEASFRQMELDSLKDLVSYPMPPEGCRKPCYPSGRRGRGPSLAMGGIVSGTPPEASEPGNMILSLGGGTIMTPECAELVHGHTLCIYLRASVETLVKHLEGEAEGRPMLASGGDEGFSPSDALRKKITELMALRSETYEKTAHIIIDTDGKSIDMISDEILNKIR